MATPLSATSMVTALRAERCTVVEVGSWRTHNRNHKGAWGPVNGVMIHHTVSKGSAHTVDLCRRGHATLPGPLCHGVITKDGRVHLVGHGRANHAGSGDDDVLAAVVAERATPAPNENNTDGNRHFYGFECENLGDGKDPWPDVQVEATARAAAALCRAHGWSERSVIGHAEWTNTKIDPRRPGQSAGQFMDAIRARVKQLLAGDSGKPPAADPPKQENPPKKEATMQAKDQLAVQDWLVKQFPNEAGLKDKKVTVETALVSGYGHAKVAVKLLGEQAREIAALKLTVAELTAAVKLLGEKKG